MITVNAGNFVRRRARWCRHSSTLTVEDAEAIRREVAGAQYVAAGQQTQTQVIAGNQNWFTRIQGRCRPATDSCVANQHGAFFSSQDVTSATKVAVLGKTVNDTPSASMRTRPARSFVCATSPSR